MSGDPKDTDPSDDADSPEEGTTPRDAEPPETANSPEAREVFHALSSERRRVALYYLRDRESTTLGELSTVVAGWLQAREDEAEVVTPDDRDRVRIQLHHVHLPKLDDAGFVRYDVESGRVALDSVPALLDELLDSSLEQERFAFGTRSPTGPDDDRGEP